MKKNLKQALTTLKTPKEAEALLIDLLTPAELEEFETRWQIAVLLWTTDKTYKEIAKELETSTTTVTRVARFLYKERHKGYATVLERLFPKKK